MTKIITEFTQQSEAWFKWREGKITSSTAKTLVGYKDLLKADLVRAIMENPAMHKGDDEKVIGKLKVDELKEAILEIEPDFDFRTMAYKANEDFEYRMLAHELSDGTAPVEEARDRGHRLEPVAREEFAAQAGKTIVEVGGLEREDEPRICMSPDGVMFNGDIIDESVEIKCLAGWRHVKNWLKNEIPSDHREQVVDYFVVNDNLKRLFFISYCPEIKKHPMHVIVVERIDIENDIKTMLEAQKQFLAEHDERLKQIYFG